jgi:hypothetical protein
MNGVFEGDLGGGVIKKRLALNEGKSGGARSIIFFKQGSNLFYFDGWAKDGTKKGAKEIEDDQLEGFREQAKIYLRSDATAIKKLVDAGIVREVTCNEN